jgi:predicted nucleic acid-binding protein
MALTHLLDTSVVSRLGTPEVRVVIEPLAHAGRIEVGYGSRNAHEWDQDMADLSVFELVETTAAHLRRARQVQRLLASRSQRGRKVPDLLIAAAAEQSELTLLHYDNDFELIAKVTGQTCQWVVPAGTID